MALDWQHQFFIKSRSGPHVLNPLPHSPSVLQYFCEETLVFTVISIVFSR